MKVWLIENGDYSAYSVHAVCMSEDDAEATCSRLNMLSGADGDDYYWYSHSEREVVTEDDVVLLSVARAQNEWVDGAYLNEMRDSGEVFTRVGFRHEVGVDGEAAIDDSGVPSWVRAIGLTSDEARKIAQDRWYQMLAESQGLT